MLRHPQSFCNCDTWSFFRPQVFGHVDTFFRHTDQCVLVLTPSPRSVLSAAHSISQVRICHWHLLIRRRFIFGQQKTPLCFSFCIACGLEVVWIILHFWLTKRFATEKIFDPKVAMLPSRLCKSSWTSDAATHSSYPPSHTVTHRLTLTLALSLSLSWPNDKVFTLCSPWSSAQIKSVQRQSRGLPPQKL